MRSRRTIVDWYYRTRSNYRRAKRLIFPSPAEVRFVELLGGHIYRLSWLRDPATNFPAVIILSRGKILRQAKMKREVRYGRYYVDFANDIHWVIEIDGSPYHQDVVQDFDREVYLRDLIHKATRGKQDLRLLRIRAPRIWNDRNRLQNEIVSFLNK